MVIINENQLEIRINTEHPEEYLDNLRRGLFHGLKAQSLNGGDHNTDPEGNNFHTLDFLEELQSVEKMIVKTGPG